MTADQQRRGGRRKHAGEQRVAARGRGSGGDRGLEHLARLARVADDQDLRMRRPGARHRRTGKRQRQVCGEEVAGTATDPVRAE